jgi:arginyl-tRNA synthetase
MAGYERFHGCADPQASGERPDQYVGRSYAEYLSTFADSGHGETTAPGDPADAEGVLRGDRADELNRHWASGDPAVRELWERVRGWALDGQARTLERLGGRWDRVHHESDSLETVRSFVQRGLAEGVFTRGAGGAIVYETGRSEYGLLKLLREDGFPTEHARVIGLFLGEQASTAEVDAWIVVCGDEWGKAGELELEVAGRVAGRALVEKVEVLAHGMVTVAGSKMKSRDGQAILIDDFLDGLAGSSEVQAILNESARPVSEQAVVDLLVKGYFLSRKPSKGLEFRWEPFTDERSNPAWSVARAWCRAQRPAAGTFDPERYRTAAMQVFQYRQLLARSPDGFQGTTLMKFANGLAAWYLSAPSDERLDRVVRSLLRACLRTLGISTAGRDDA